MPVFMVLLLELLTFFMDSSGLTYVPVTLYIELGRREIESDHEKPFCQRVVGRANSRANPRGRGGAGRTVSQAPAGGASSGPGRPDRQRPRGRPHDQRGGAGAAADRSSGDRSPARRRSAARPAGRARGGPFERSLLGR